MIYLDHAATTPLRPEVREEMAPFLADDFGNPSGVHSTARAARRAVDLARERVGAVLGCEPGEVVFTGGGTEADNLAVTGCALRAIANGAEAALVCCSGIEHPAVLEPVRFLGGIEIAVKRSGAVDLEHLRAVLEVEQDRVVLVSVMSANNETGVIQPLAAAGELVGELAPGALVHTDAVQALRWIDLAVEAVTADLISVSAHKVGGPKGVGALVVRAGARNRLSPILRGGPQEHELRAGTQNVAGIVGFAAAAELAHGERRDAAARVGALTDRLLGEILAAVPDALPVAALGPAGPARLPSILNIGFPGVDGEELLFLLDQAGVAASAGSACASGALEPSPVLLAMGLSTKEAKEHLRFSLGPSTTNDEIEVAARAVGDAVARSRG
ncbi:MAG: cysteine desulfurase family protein [Acidimicrobiales bacterium]